MSPHTRIACWLLAVSLAPAQSIQKIPANPDLGFSWPYYLSTPSTVKSPPVLLVIPNNTGNADDDPAFHDAAARAFIDWAALNYQLLFGSPVLVPVFPRPASNPEVYTHALNRAALLTKMPGLERIDLQLAAMIQDARARLTAAGIAVDSRVWMQGFSASGSFVSRFVALHPELVRAASIGSPGYGPILPVAEWNGVPLPYPGGVADLEDVAGIKFNLDAFRQVALQIYVGDMDDNIVPWFNPTLDPEVALVVQLRFRGPMDYLRWPQYEAAYQSAGAQALFTIYPGDDHNYSNAYFLDFFELNRQSASPVIPPKPRHHKFVFPQVLRGDGYDTEIVLTNTGEAPASADLDARSESDGSSLQSISLTLPPRARSVVPIGKTFAGTDRIGYLMLAADSGFLSAFTRITRGTISVSAPAAISRPRGVLLLTSSAGPATLVLQNVEDKLATVRLWAYDDNGLELARSTLQLKPGERFTGPPETLLGPAASGARRVRYYADRNLVGFALTDSPDRTTFDTLPAAPEYSR